MEKLSKAADILKFIEIEWTDIHHSRNQEWKILVIVGLVFYALFQCVVYGNPLLSAAISLLGIIACALGGYISYRHWYYFWVKKNVIIVLEKEVGVTFPGLRSKLPVSGTILLTYFFMGDILVGWLLWNLFKVVGLYILASYFAFFSFLVLFILSIFYCVKLTKKIKVKADNATKNFTIEGGTNDE